MDCRAYEQQVEAERERIHGQDLDADYARDELEERIDGRLIRASAAGLCVRRIYITADDELSLEMHGMSVGDLAYNQPVAVDEYIEDILLGVEL